METMSALCYLGPRSLRWQEQPLARLEGPGEALVRPLAVAACDLDFAIVAGKVPFEPPFALGHEFAGEVVALGDTVSAFAVGDRVAVAFQPSCGTCDACGHAVSSACSSVAGTAMYGIGSAGGAWGGALADLVRVPYAEAMMVKLPATMTPGVAAGAGDNIADGYRCVAPGLDERPGASVLVAGNGSIPLYAVWWALALGASAVTFASRDATLLSRAEAFGADVELVKNGWPRRFRTHDVAVDCTNEPDGLGAVLRSTAAYGRAVSASIYFSGAVPVPMFDLNMKGIRFETGRVNSTALLPTVLGEIERLQLRPETVGASLVPFEHMDDALLDGCFKPIAVREEATG